MVEKPSSALVHNANTVLKPSLKKKSGFENSSVGGKRHPTGRRLSFSDENGGNLAKYYPIASVPVTSAACIIS